MTKTIAAKEERKGRYACLLYDSTMKTILGTARNEELFIDIIELLIPGKRIASLEMLNKEHHGFVNSEKYVTFDLLCTDKDTGEEFLVEVQNAEERTYRERMLYYSYFPIREQLERKALDALQKKAKMDYSLRPVYVISLLNFSLKHDSEEALENGYISRYEIRNGHTRECFSSALNFVFVEMGRLPFRAHEESKCRTRLERFVFSFKYMHTFTEFPKSFMEDPLLWKLAHAAELANLPVEQLNKYEKDMIDELDRELQKEFAHDEGFAEGGAKTKTAIASAMLADNVSPEKVAQYTGLTVAEIEALASANA